MAFNPYNPYGVPQKSPEQMQQEINQLMGQYQNMFNQAAQPTQSTKPQAVGERGEFVKVSDFNEVEDAPTRLDGTATLFFDFKNRVFWSKKFSNGGHSIQAFKFEPVNVEDPIKVDDSIDYTKAFEDVPDPTEERFSKLESSVGEILALIKPSKPQKKEKEAPKDEI